MTKVTVYYRLCSILCRHTIYKFDDGSQRKEFGVFDEVAHKWLDRGNVYGQPISK